MSAELANLVHHFKEWADTNPRDYGEWESDWEHSDQAYTAIGPILLKPPSEISEQTFHLVLYMLARDNEAQHIQEELESNPVLLLTLASRGLSSSEPDARWQLADSLGRIQTGESPSLLDRYAEDPNEYVRRRALGAMAESGHPATESHRNQSIRFGRDIFAASGARCTSTNRISGTTDYRRARSPSDIRARPRASVEHS